MRDDNDFANVEADDLCDRIRRQPHWEDPTGEEAVRRIEHEWEPTLFDRRQLAARGAKWGT